jgi:hypothetical protein
MTVMYDADGNPIAAYFDDDADGTVDRQTTSAYTLITFAAYEAHEEN